MCPKAEQGSMIGKEWKPCLGMEIICDLDLHIWHIGFGYPGFMNDKKVLSVSSYFAKVLTGFYPPFKVSYIIDRVAFDWFYYLVDGIYSNFSTCLKPSHMKRMNAVKNFAARQEAVRKCVERVFGVLFKRFFVLATPARLWYVEYMRAVLFACCVMQNMLVELRCVDYLGDGGGGNRQDTQGMNPIVRTQVSFRDVLQGVSSRSVSRDIKSVARHYRLTDALVHHIDLHFSRQ